MKKNIGFILTIILSITVLVACNTKQDSTTEPSSSDTNETVTDNANGTEEKTTPTENDTEQSTDTITTTTENESTTISYTSKGKNFDEKTTTVSGEQYSIQVIPGFTLTPEEPGKDVLMYDEDDTVSMRIESMSINDTTFNELVANTEETIAAINEQYEPFELTPYVGEHSLKNSTSYIANFENESVIAVVFEKGDRLVRLTIYDNKEAELSEAMIKMGLSIK